MKLVGTHLLVPLASGLRPRTYNVSVHPTCSSLMISGSYSPSSSPAPSDSASSSSSSCSPSDPSVSLCTLASSGSPLSRRCSAFLTHLSRKRALLGLRDTAGATRGPPHIAQKQSQDPMINLWMWLYRSTRTSRYCFVHPHPVSSCRFLVPGCLLVSFGGHDCATRAADFQRSVCSSRKKKTKDASTNIRGKKNMSYVPVENYGLIIEE